MEETIPSAVDCLGVHEVLPPGRTTIGEINSSDYTSLIVNVIGSPFIMMHGVSEQFRIPSSTYFFFS